jgi:hypothetical protein
LESGGEPDERIGKVRFPNSVSLLYGEDKMGLKQGT